jgi:hypothetical protein
MVKQSYFTHGSQEVEEVLGRDQGKIYPQRPTSSNEASLSTVSSLPKCMRIFFNLHQWIKPLIRSEPS